MSPRKNILSLLACLSTTLVMSQFPVVGTWLETLYPLRSLSSGIKYIPKLDTSLSSITLYNTDLSVFRVLNIPEPPEGMQWGQPFYVTEELFDTDPTTIEYVLQRVPTEPGIASVGVYVFREDGTEVFSQDPGHLTWGPHIDVNETGPIYTEAGQTYMLIHQPLGWPPATIYALPGTLPCLDCYGSPTSGLITGGASLSDPFSGMVLQPNPAQNEVVVTFGKTGVQVDAILVMDVSGREVLRQRSTGPTVTLQVAQLATGSYTVLAVRGTDRIGSLPLIITR